MALTAHQQQIARAIMDVLSDPEGASGGLIAESVLHGAVRQVTTPPASLAEFEEALRFCEGQRWVTSQRGKLTALRWAITDEGRVARRDM